MASNRFALLLLFRILLLSLCLLAFSFAFIAEEFYMVTIIMTLASTVVIMELFHFINRTNREVYRFFESVKYRDFSQNFRPSSSTVKLGSGFNKLSENFSAILSTMRETWKNQQKKLKHLETLAGHVPVPIISLFNNGGIKLRNNAARKMFSGIDIQNLNQLNHFGQDFKDAIYSLKPGVPALINYRYDGMERQLIGLMTQIKTENLTENIISLQDIQRELDSIEIKAWHDLVRVLTHEIMNSITPVASLARTTTNVVDKLESDIKTEQSHEVILNRLKDAHRAAATVSRRSEGILEFVNRYRSLTQVPLPQKQYFVIEDLFNNVVNLLLESESEEYQSSTISIEILPQKLALRADLHLLEQILINLIKNSLQAFVGTGKLQIILSARLNLRNNVIIEVSDNGPGISDKIEKEIFVPFFTTKKHGSGIGLSLSKQALIAHNANIHHSNIKSGGVRFVITFN